MLRTASAVCAFVLLAGACATTPAASPNAASVAPATAPTVGPASPSASVASVATPTDTASPTPPASSPPGSVLLAYEDTAQAEIVSPGGQRVMIDVWNPDLLSRPADAKDVLLTTHSHDDHYAAQWVDAFPGRTLTFQTGRLVAGDVTITGIAAAHNEGDPILPKGGTDYLFLVEVAGIRIAHLGDLGQNALTAAQRKALGRVDVVLSQLTNQFSDATLANRKGIHLVEQLQPKLFIPTHVLDDTVAELKDVAGVWPAAYATSPWIRLSPGTLPNATTVLFLGTDAPTFAKLTNASPFTP
jgi:L-ascorbate metabolism protein UlaG (beta-lactamase superfamily)